MRRATGGAVHRRQASAGAAAAGGGAASEQPAPVGMKVNVGGADGSRRVVVAGAWRIGPAAAVHGQLAGGDRVHERRPVLVAGEQSAVGERGRIAVEDVLVGRDLGRRILAAGGQQREEDGEAGSMASASRRPRPRRRRRRRCRPR